jgi:hypothetical protein
VTEKPRPNFLPADLSKAIKAVEKSGKSLAAVDFPPHGGFRLLLGEPVTIAADRAGGNEWDEVLAVQ